MLSGIQKGKCEEDVKVVNSVTHGKRIEFGDEPGEVHKVPKRAYYMPFKIIR